MGDRCVRTDLLALSEIAPDEIRYFRWREQAAEYFCSRFDGIPFSGKRVLDFGCGHGGIALLAARQGAAHVLAVDLNARLIGLAQALTVEFHPMLAPHIEYQQRDIVADPLLPESIDLVVSEATFEHVTGLALYVEALHQALVPGGRLYAGFAPLYNAPWGDHGRLKAPLARIWPWAHRLWPQQWLLRRVGAASLADLGLGGTSTAEYLRIFRECGMTTVSLECNNQRRWYARALEPLRRMAHEALTFSIYVVLEKPA